MQRTLALVVSFCLSVLMISPAFADSKNTVSGTVTAPNGDPLVGASVMVKGTTARGVVVDITGNYTIVAEEGEVLVYDCLGYVSKEVKVAKAKTTRRSAKKAAPKAEETPAVEAAPAEEVKE